MLNKENIYYDMLIALRQVIRCTDLHSKQLVKKYGLTGPQLILVQVIANKGEITLGTLAKEVSLSQATVANIVERLELRGVLRRRKTENDKRMVLVSVTDKAQEILAQKPSLLDPGFIDKFEKLCEWEKNLIMAMLQRIAHMMTESDEKIDTAFLATPFEAVGLNDNIINK
ncbi:MAG: MarR family transcriptional regulator [Spirochaetales bacterium]|nr:MarR family transcriptional regulator [Spirochaetales bacterium]